MSGDGILKGQVPVLSAQAAEVDAGLRDRLTALKRRGAGVVLAWAGVFAGWALWAPISGGVVAQGLVKVDANRRIVTHRDGGTVARILVREGQSVRQGDTLIELEDVRVDASVDMIRAQLAADRLRHARLLAETRGAATWSPPAEVLQAAAGVKNLAELVNKERTTFSARRDNLMAQVAGDQRQADDTRTEIAVRLREHDNAGRAVALMQDELRQNEQLEKEHFVNRAKVLSLQRSVSEYESRQLSNDAELAQARQRLGALEAHMRTLRDNLVQQAAEELRDASSRIADNEQRLRSSTDDQSRQRVLSPISGRLLNLRVNTVGSALGAREPIVDVVPEGLPLRVEARLPLDAAADVRPGMQAELRVLTAQARYEKLLPAEVVQVSADAIQDERSGGQYVAIQVQVPAAALAEREQPLQPGMAAEVYIKVAERTPMGFLIEPVGGYFRRAFREH